MKKSSAIMGGILSTLLTAHAANATDTPPISTTDHSDRFLSTAPDISPKDIIALPDAPTPPSAMPVLTDDSIKGRINAAMLSHDWASLAPLLTAYQGEPDYDHALYLYALGALRRSQLRHAEAIALYREFVSIHPSLAYPRFDYGVMLFEDKQYREARHELTRAEADLSPEMQVITERYLSAIDKAERWQFDGSLNYDSTDNVNNASSARTIEMGGRVWQKTEDSLPKSAHGIRYGLSASREKNISANHFILGSASMDGVHYWDNEDFSELSTRLQGGYGFRDVKRSWSVQPFTEKNWLGGSSYNSQYGATADYSYRLSPAMQLSGAYTHIQKRYDDELTARRYDGYFNGASVSSIWQPNANMQKSDDARWVFIGGLDGSVDKLKDDAESSHRIGARMGAVYLHPDWGMRANIRYAKRDFDAVNIFSQTVRRDDEYQFDSAIWHHKLSWHGITPRLNYRYTKIDSNIPALYSRDSSNWFITVDKAF